MSRNQDKFSDGDEDNEAEANNPNLNGLFDMLVEKIH
jgi:hypothetical protein